MTQNHRRTLRVYGADRASGCTDTRLVRPVEPLDRDAVKRAVDGVRPKGDTPIGVSPRRAAQELPEPAGGAIGTRTILLISDGEDNCGTPEPCRVAEQLARAGVGLRIDAVGFQVKGAAREQSECVAAAGNGRYYDAPDADAPARRLQRAGRLRSERRRPELRAGRRTLPPVGGSRSAVGPGARTYSYGSTELFTPARFPVGAEPAGPEHGAPVLVRESEGEGEGEGKNGDKRGNAAGAGDSGGAGGAGWTGIAAAAGAGALVVAAGGFLLVRRRGSRGRLG